MRRSIRGGAAVAMVVAATGLVGAPTAQAAPVACEVNRSVDTAYFLCAGAPGAAFMNIECAGYSVGLGAVFFSNPQFPVYRMSDFLVAGATNPGAHELSCNRGFPLSAGVLVNAWASDTYGG